MLNVTPTCPNSFEGVGVVYKRIPVSDTGTQKLSNKFSEAFEYVGKERNYFDVQCQNFVGNGNKICR